MLYGGIDGGSINQHFFYCLFLFFLNVLIWEIYVDWIANWKVRATCNMLLGILIKTIIDVENFRIVCSAMEERWVMSFAIMKVNNNWHKNSM